MPTYSVVIPVLNGSPYIAAALQSVLRQTHLPDEIIVVDNMSTDDTIKIVENFIEHEHRIKLVQNSNKGVSSTRNLGIQSASGQYIAFLDADDLWDARKIEAHSDHLRVHENCVFSFTNSFESSVTRPWSGNESLGNPSYSFRSTLINEFVVNVPGTSLNVNSSS